MKAETASSTAQVIARGLLLANTDPSLRPLLLGDTAVLTRRLLHATSQGSWFEFALRRRPVQRFLFAVERLILPGILLHWLARKSLFDALAREALAAGCRQIVIIGAGLDTLAWRMQSACPCFEVDHPATQALKHSVLAGGPVLIPADFMEFSLPEVLRAEPRYDRESPTFFIAEGLLMYLPPTEVDRLFRDLASFSPPESRFAFSFMEKSPGGRLGFRGSHRAVDWWLRLCHEPFQWGLARADAEAFGTRHGWQLASLSSPEELRRRFLEPRGLATAALAIGESVALLYRGTS